MKVKIVARANEYSSKGWSYMIDDDIEHSWYENDKTYIVLGIVDLPEPKISQLVEMGLAKVADMQKDRIEEAANWERRVKEYESKFILLDAPDKKELT